MSHKMLRPFIVKVSVLGYFPLDNIYIFIIKNLCIQINYICAYTKYTHTRIYIIITIHIYIYIYIHI